MQKAKQYLLFIFFSVYCLPVFAADLIDIYQLAMISDPEFRAAKSTLMSKQEAVPQARSNLLPNLNASANTSQNYYRVLDATMYDASISTGSSSAIKYNTNGYAVNISQPLFNFGSWMKLNQASAEVKQAEAQFGAATQELIIRVARAYFNILAAKDNLQLARDEREANQKQYQQAKEQQHLGLVPVTNVYDAQASYDRASVQEIAAANQLRNYEEALRQLTGATYANIENFKISLPLLSPQPASIQNWLDSSAKFNLNLLAQRYTTEAARQKIKVNNDMPVDLHTNSQTINR